MFESREKRRRLREEKRLARRDGSEVLARVVRDQEAVIRSLRCQLAGLELELEEARAAGGTA